MGKKLLIGLSVGGLTLLALGLVACFVYPVIYNNEASLVEGSEVYDEWQAPDYPIYMKFTMFSFNNSDEFLNGTDDSPSVQQVGLLSYREYQNKVNISFEADSKKVRYYNNKMYVFDEATSTMAENDTVVVPNILLFTLAQFAEDSVAAVGDIVRNVTNTLCKSGNSTEENSVAPFYTVEGGDLLWGYNENALLVALQTKLDEFPYSLLKITIPTSIGLQLNDTNDGLYEIYTGKGDDNSNRGIIEKWNNSTTLSYWNETSCNMINGTDGTVYPTNVNKNERLYIFNTQVCRSIFVTASADEKIAGIKTAKFTAPPEVFKVDFENNPGFCPDGNASKCLGDGLLDVSNCIQEQMKDALNLPIDLPLSVVISSPEFLDASQERIDSIIGFNPDPTKHETFINMELDSGIILKAAKRVQLNTEMKWFKDIESLPPIEPDNWPYLVPLFWGGEYLPVDDKLTGQVKQLNRVNLSVDVLSYLAIAFGCLFLVVTVALVIYASYKKRQNYDVDDVDRSALLGKQF
ncbi:lysosome membrane protein 2-like [Symsagittifera roscoffensis]|uniref:lysosome membrane protein 2-like n=1 Tax=Symsagittifera roscoffensis TaxID=84072 RepID=UPI00307CA7B6